MFALPKEAQIYALRRSANTQCWQSQHARQRFPYPPSGVRANALIVRPQANLKRIRSKVRGLAPVYCRFASSIQRFPAQSPQFPDLQARFRSSSRAPPEGLCRRTVCRKSRARNSRIRRARSLSPILPNALSSRHHSSQPESLRAVK